MKTIIAICVLLVGGSTAYFMHRDAILGIKPVETVQVSRTVPIEDAIKAPKTYLDNMTLNELKVFTAVERTLCFHTDMPSAKRSSSDYSVDLTTIDLSDFPGCTVVWGFTEYNDGRKYIWEDYSLFIVSKSAIERARKVDTGPMYGESATREMEDIGVVGPRLAIEGHRSDLIMKTTGPTLKHPNLSQGMWPSSKAKNVAVYYFGEKSEVADHVQSRKK